MNETLERSIEEIVEEVCEKLTKEEIWWVDDEEKWNIGNNLDAVEILTQTLQAERQRCEEMVKVEREWVKTIKIELKKEITETFGLINSDNYFTSGVNAGIELAIEIIGKELSKRKDYPTQ